MPRCSCPGWHPRCGINPRIPSATPQPGYILVTPDPHNRLRRGDAAVLGKSRDFVSLLPCQNRRQVSHSAGKSHPEFLEMYTNAGIEPQTARFEVRSPKGYQILPATLVSRTACCDSKPPKLVGEELFSLLRCTFIGTSHFFIQFCTCVGYEYHPRKGTSNPWVNSTPLS